GRGRGRGEGVEDGPDLTRHFFTIAEREGLPPKQIEPAALDRLKRHRWPGNVRELENLARRLAALYPQETITAAVIEGELAQPAMRVAGDEPRPDEALAGAVRRRLTPYLRGFRGGLPPPALHPPLPPHVHRPLPPPPI